MPGSARAEVGSCTSRESPLISIPQPYQDIGHTADLGVRVRGATAEEALGRLAMVLGTLLVGGSAEAAALQERLAVVTGERLRDGEGMEGTAVALLRELLFRFSTSGLVPVEIEVHRADAAGAEATVGFARYDPARHAEGTDVKAVTWHQARLQREGDGWVAQVVLDV